MNWFKKSEVIPPKDDFTEQDIDILMLFSNANFNGNVLTENHEEKTLVELTDKINRKGFTIDRRTQVLF